MRPHKFLPSMLLLILLVLTTVVSIGWYISRPQSKALAVNSNVQHLESNQATALDMVPTQQAVRTTIKPQTVSGISVDITYAKIISTGLEVGICYSTPDAGDWYVGAGHLYYGAYDIPPDEFGFTSEQKADGINMGKRCAYIRYRIDDLASISSPAKFSVIRFVAVPKEIPPCDNFQQRLATSPKAKAYGLKVKCLENDQGGVDLTLLGNSHSVAKDQAQKLVDEMQKGIVEGPWEFTIDTIDK